MEPLVVPALSQGNPTSRPGLDHYPEPKPNIKCQNLPANDGFPSPLCSAVQRAHC